MSIITLSGKRNKSQQTRKCLLTLRLTLMKHKSQENCIKKKGGLLLLFECINCVDIIINIIIVFMTSINYN